MSFAVIREHRNFFHKNHWIEFEGLLSSTQQEQIVKEIATALSIRLHVPANSVFKVSSNQIFDAGRDLWRSAQALKKALLNRKLAEIVSELIELKPLRFGYDQMFRSPIAFEDHRDSYFALLAQNPTLQEMSCIQGVLGGMLLCLPLPEGVEANSENTPSTLFSTTPGNGVVFAPDMPIPFQELSQRKGMFYMLLVYTQTNAVYCLQERDLHVHDFKQIGYHLGDRLSEPRHPLVYM